MNPALLAAILLAVFTLGLLIEAGFFYWRHDDHHCTYKLFAVRDKMVRLNVDGKIQRNDPFFAALYENVSVLLRCSRFISGPEGWPRAAFIGQHLAHRPQDAVSLARLPGDIPSAMQPVVDELRIALQHLISNHFGIHLQLDASRREQAKMQKEQARKLLAQMPRTSCHA